MYSSMSWYIKRPLKKHGDKWTEEELTQWVEDRLAGVQYFTPYGPALCSRREEQWEK